MHTSSGKSSSLGQAAAPGSRTSVRAGGGSGGGCRPPEQPWGVLTGQVGRDRGHLRLLEGGRGSWARILALGHRVQR